MVDRECRRKVEAREREGFTQKGGWGEEDERGGERMEREREEIR